MYRLRDFMRETLNMEVKDIVSDEIFCISTDAESTFLVNKMQETLDSYTFTLVTQGWLTLIYNGQELTFAPDDLYIYAPGIPVTILSASENYQGICLLADEQMVLELPVVRNVIRAAYFPLVELNKPKIHLSPEESKKLELWMRHAIDILGSDHLFKSEALRTLLTLFLLDLMNDMERNLVHHRLSERTEKLFISFIRLLPKHFLEHHDIRFYADRLHITTTYLSRIVRQVTGRTVVDYISQMLLMEASWLLQTTDLSIAVIAERLHFADQSSFGRFFTRMKGVNPKRFRMER
ncbi:MAG: AraC family transcriptional regulator [Bacteroidaceae bacterium]|nr:AraC family transcriptional regulator [Bacteroidaceae bacterium]